MKIRTTQPKNNKYYIRQVSGGLNGAVAGSPTISTANVLCNCVGFSNGRFNEIINDPEMEGIYKAFKYQLVCNAENFIESAKKQGLKISSVPVQGGIMVWQRGATLSGSDGAGHVAVVEEIYSDGSILTSESGWAAWAFKTIRRTNENGRWGQSSAYKFRGCIINPSVTDAKVAPTPKLTVDGIGGANTIRATQQFFGTPEDGVLSGQNKSLKKYYPSITAVEYGKGGSACVKKLQKWVGTTQDGVLGEKTIKAWQKKLISEKCLASGQDDGIFGAVSMKAWQKYLNSKLFADNTQPAEPPKPSIDYSVIDISEFQDTIDFAKVKDKGIKGVIVRCGYRGATSGNLIEDKRFLEHIRNAHKAGLAVGIYMFTEGITAEEGKEEADFAIKMWTKANVPISYPIAVDTENVNVSGARANGLSKAKRTEVIKAFCEEIKAKGYEPMIYASTSWLNNKLDMSKLPYKVWVAQYASICEYKGDYIMWQYTSEAKVNGVPGVVDMNHCYVNPKEIPCPRKSVDELAHEVLDGKWGSGNARKKNLEAEGYDYDAVQKRVNEILAEKEALIDKLAQEVLDGKWGNGDARKEALTKAGYDYDAIQKRVNEIVESRKTIVDRELEACKEQADWMKNSTYGYEKNPTIEKSKKRGTCVTYVACVLQRIGVLKSGQNLWHDEDNKVYGDNDRMEVIYPQNKTLSQLKGELKAGDIVMDGSGVGSGSHIFILTGKWSGNQPIIWDNHSGQQGKGAYTYTRNRKVIAIVRLK